MLRTASGLNYSGADSLLKYIFAKEYRELIVFSSLFSNKPKSN
jgi:hypothetical protein